MGMGNVHKLSMFTNGHKSQMKSLFAENWRAIRTAAGCRPYHMGDSLSWEGRAPSRPPETDEVGSDPTWGWGIAPCGRVTRPV